jgi:hypothetical protein
MLCFTERSRGSGRGCGRCSDVVTCCSHGRSRQQTESRRYRDR